MGYVMKKKITKVNKTVMNNKKNQYIVVHYTGNKTDTASANANYFYSVNRGASAHYFVDDTEIYQVVEDKNAAWHVGVNYGNKNLFGKCTNQNSIGIEMTSKNGKISTATFNNTVALIKKLMKKYDIDADHVVRHYDVCSKNCPGWTGWLPSSNEKQWKKLKKKIKTAKKTTKTDAVEYKITAKNGLNVRRTTSTSSKIVNVLEQNKRVYITKTVKKGTKTWGKLKNGTGYICIKAGLKKYAKKV